MAEQINQPPRMQADTITVARDVKSGKFRVISSLAGIFQECDTLGEALHTAEDAARAMSKHEASGDCYEVIKTFQTSIDIDKAHKLKNGESDEKVITQAQA